MSEYTSGILFLSRHSDTIRSQAKGLSLASLIHTLNERWTVLLPEWDATKITELSNWLETASHQAPLLDFQNAEDNGWGYRLFYEGAQVASLDVSYDIDWNMMVAIFEKRHPGVDFYSNLSTNEISVDTQAIFKEIKKSKAYWEAVAKQYRQKDLSKFSIFDIEAEILAELDGILIPESYLDADRKFAQVTHFKRLLGFPEMSWMSYDYLRRRQIGENQ